MSHETVVCYGGPLDLKQITDPGEGSRVYSAGSNDVAGLLTRRYWPGAVGFYQRAINLHVAEWHELEK